MVAQTLEEVIQSTENTAEMFRNNDLEWQPYVFRDEYTNWIEEQRAVRESCAVVDQSYHMEILKLEGPETIDLLSKLGVNSFEKIKNGDPPQAINYLTCSPDGYVIGDVIVFYLGENEFTSVGSEWINNWIRYNVEVNDFDVRTEVPYHPFDDHAPPDFRFQVQGPNALDVMEEVVDHSLPDVSFFEMDTVQINGTNTFALGHGMASTPGLEIFGPHEHHDEVLNRILQAGEPHGIRRMGTKAYKTGKIGSGWFVAAVPAIYDHDDLEGYREWLSADSMEAQLSIGGSFDSDDISDYYMTPIEQGKAHLIDLDHDFIGKEALAEMIDDEPRERVTLVWDSDGVVDIYASLFQDGATQKFINLPDVATQWSVTHYDTVLKDGKIVGLSKYPGYLYYKREMLSLATIDKEYSDPGTEVTFVWGDNTEKQRVERHDQVKVSATVAPAPYVRGGRTDM
jgi:vanillate/3-O-methylgallate O-demethylase